MSGPVVSRFRLYNDIETDIHTQDSSVGNFSRQRNFLFNCAQIRFWGVVSKVRLLSRNYSHASLFGDHTRQTMQ